LVWRIFYSFLDLLWDKNNQMLFIIKQTFLITFIVSLFAGCQTRPLTSIEKSQQVKEKSDKKRKEEYRKAQSKARKEHYNMQAESTREMMEENRRFSDQWMNKNFNKKPFFERVKDFFHNSKPKPKADAGLFSKKQKRKTKKNIFQRIFKKKK